MLKLDTQQDKAAPGPGLDSYHLSYTFRVSQAGISESSTIGPRKPLLTKQEVRWFEIGNEAVAHKAKTGEWGKFSAWVNNARKSWGAVRLSEDQIAFLKKHKISIKPNEADRTAGGAKAKSGGKLARLFDLHDRREDLTGSEKSEYEGLIRKAQTAYDRGEITVTSHRTAMRLGFKK